MLRFFASHCVLLDLTVFARLSPVLFSAQIGGVGKVQEKCLREAMGVVTCGDLFRERAACLHVMTPHTSRWLIKVSAVLSAYRLSAVVFQWRPITEFDRSVFSFELRVAC